MDPSEESSFWRVEFVVLKHSCLQCLNTDIRFTDWEARNKIVERKVLLRGGSQTK